MKINLHLLKLRRYLLPDKLPKGFIFGLLTALCFSFMNLCFKLLKGLPTQEIVLARSIIVGGLIWAYMQAQGTGIWGRPENKWSLIGRGIAGYLALSAYIFSLKYLDLGTATFIQFMSPLFSGVLAWALLSESIKSKQWLSLLIGLFGVGFISHFLPALDLSAMKSPISVSLCLFSSIMGALAYVLVRKISVNGENANVIIFYFAAVSLPPTLIYTLWHGVWPSVLEWGLLLLMGLFAYFGQIFLTYAIKSTKTALATNMLYLTPVLATIWGTFFLGEDIGIWFLIGVSLIIVAQALLIIKAD